MKFFDYSMVKDPTYFKDGRMEAHSDYIYYRDTEEAAEKETSFRYDLNGIWKFHYARNYGSAVQGFEAKDYCCRDWDDIRVPAHIQMEGYDVPQYANVQYPWEGHEDIHPGEIPEHFNPVASYVKYFEVPEEMQGKRLFISFQGTEIINEEKPLDGEEIYSWTVQAPVLWSAEDPQLYDLTKDRLRNCKKCKSIRKESCI